VNGDDGARGGLPLSKVDIASIISILRGGSGEPGVLYVVGVGAG
jgi:hypothetical protein